MNSAALYDHLGPRGRRQVRIASAVGLVLLIALLALAGLRLHRQGQFAREMWAPLFDPRDAEFGLVWSFLLGGLTNTFRAAALAIVLSLIFGVLIVVVRLSANRAVNGVARYTIEVLRGVPVVLTIFLAARVLPSFGVDLPLIWYIVIGLTVYNSVVIAEVLRAGILALPAGQAEAAKAIGLTRSQEFRLIVLPQAFRIMLPAIIGQLVVIVKDTSLGFIIGFEELLRRGQIAVQSLDNPLQTYLVVALVFILVNYFLGRLAEFLERRLGRTRPATTAKARRRVQQAVRIEG